MFASMLLAAILGYLLLNVGVGWWASRRVKSAQDYVLAGRSLSLVLAASVTFATWFGSETIMGAPAKFVEGGLLAVIEEPFGSALCLFLVGAFYARPLYKLGITTFCDYFRLRYGRAAELLSAGLMIPSYFSWIAAQLLAIGIVMHTVTGVPVAWGITLSAAIVAIYTLMGGMWSISITDFFHNFVIIGALLIVAATLYGPVGGWAGLTRDAPAGFFRFTPDWTFQNVVNYAAAWMTIGLGSIPQQDIFQRVMAARTATTSVRASYVASGLYLSVAMLPLFIALAARRLHPDLPADAQMLIPNMVMRHGGLGLQMLFFGALLSAILSVSSGAILAPATVFGENVVKFFRPTLSDRALLQTIRWAVLVITVLCVILTTSRDVGIFDLVGESSAFSLVSLFVPLTAGLYWKRATRLGCLLSMGVGFSVWLLGLWWPALEETTGVPPMLWGLLASTAGMIVGSLLRSGRRTD